MIGYEIHLGFLHFKRKINLLIINVVEETNYI